ncbi:hypothetical protein CRG98_019310 [Punica granatum]|uniref:Uncharacterized protein n=1 Tax=Punica granatum TaxID=22663 RepID=A0A2I0JVF4_PUNGR|nr:hypothetical protein CRG98_019310 [Punica granatum]
MAEEQQPVISEQDAPPMPAHSFPQDTHVMSSPASIAYSGVLPTHLPSPAQAPSNVVDPVRFVALERMARLLMPLLQFYRRTFLYGPECGLSSGPALRAFGSIGLGVSTFPRGCVTDTRERRSRHLSLYDPKVEGG